LFALQGRDLSAEAAPSFSIDRERAREALVTLVDELGAYPPTRGGRVDRR